MTKGPRAVLLLPEVGRARAFRELVERLARHDRLRELLRGDREFLVGNAQVLENLFREARREFAVVPTRQRHAFFARDVAAPDLLARVDGRTPVSELDPRRVVVEIVDAVVDAAVLAVRP